MKLLLIAGALTLMTATAFASTITNPLIPQRADPHIRLHTDGYYYLTATVPEYDRIELRRARTIADLATAEAKTVWHRHESGPMSHHIWAPEIHFIDGKWYLYFAAGRAEAIWHIRMYVLENASPNPMEGSWSEKGEIETDWDSFALDATTFEHRGERYLVWAQSPPRTRGTSLYIAKMDTPWSIVSPQVMITRPEFDWERIGHHVNEGPSVLHRNGRLFMTYSASATDHNYCLGLLTADEEADLLDPASWAKSPEPVFRSSAATSQYGPGHNSFTTSPDGEIDYIVYHARGYRDIQGEPLNNPDRATRVQVLQWKQDGTPDFGIPVADGPLPPPGYELVWSDEFDQDGPPNPANWTFEHGLVRNREAQFYQPQNAWVENGLLVIEARRERVENPRYEAGSSDWRHATAEAEYTSASLLTRGLHSWRYGRFEMRGRIDIRPGMWPAWWTLGVHGEWPSNGEIDIMEYYRGKLLANVAWGTDRRWTARWDSSTLPVAELGGKEWADEFHIWRMDWDESSIRLYVDDRLLNETPLATTVNPDGTNPFHQPHYMILNLAIGGDNGGDPSATEFPARFEVDWVRVYQRVDNAR